MERVNPLLSAGVAMMAGDVMGIAIDTLMQKFDGVVRSMDLDKKMSAKTYSLLDSVLGVFLHVGVIGLGTELLSRAVPWIFEEPAGLTLFILGLYNTSPHLTLHLNSVNEQISKLKEPTLEPSNRPPEETATASKDV